MKKSLVGITVCLFAVTMLSAAGASTQVGVYPYSFNISEPCASSQSCIPVLSTNFPAATTDAAEFVAFSADDLFSLTAPALGTVNDITINLFDKYTGAYSDHMDIEAAGQGNGLYTLDVQFYSAPLGGPVCPFGVFNCWSLTENPNGRTDILAPIVADTSVGGLGISDFGAAGVTSPETPEPSSIMLFGSGILGLAGVLRRRIMR